ncbi:MAG: HAD family hydrolase [Planctomycetota bacterium]|nr:HAD family hydrolase [Planctomycetota bacterium]
MHSGVRLELRRRDHVKGHVIAGVVFDLDGTLTRPGAIDFAAMRRRIGMEERGSVLHWIETRASGPAEREEMHRIVVEVEDEALAGMELADGFDEVLESLRARRGELVAGISTRNSASALVRFGELLEARGHGALGDHFQALVARGHRSPFLGRELAHKPSPEPAHECVRVWGLTGRVPLVTRADVEPAGHPELLFVGDDIDDCRCGRRAGFEAALLEEPGARRFEGDAAARRRVASLVEVARWLAVRG